MGRRKRAVLARTANFHNEEEENLPKRQKVAHNGPSKISRDNKEVRVVASRGSNKAHLSRVFVSECSLSV